MARFLRPRIIGLTHHVIQRGNNKSDIFRATNDYEVFLASIAEACTLHDVTVNAYALMTNHVHLMMTPQSEDGVSRVMQSIGRRYVFYFNRAYDRTGGLFEGRYRATVIDNETYWYTCARYVELNPVRAGLLARPEDYRWSSCRSHALGTSNRLLTHHDLYLRLGDTPRVRQEAWRTILGEALPSDQLEALRCTLHRGTGVRPPRRGVQGSDPGDESTLGSDPSDGATQGVESLRSGV
jgi:REP-associated tyrosine transposase